MLHFEPNRYMQGIEVCENFVDNGHTVTHQTRIKEEISLQLKNVCNIQNIN